MTKQEFVWVLIRVAGVYLAYLAIITFFTMMSSGWGLIFAPPKLETDRANANRAANVPGIPAAPFDPNLTPAAEKQAAEPLNPEDKASREAVMKLIWALILTVIYGGLGFYLLRDGRILYALLMNEESEKSGPAEPEVTTLNL